MKKIELIEWFFKKTIGILYDVQEFFKILCFIECVKHCRNFLHSGISLKLFKTSRTINDSVNVF